MRLTIPVVGSKTSLEAGSKAHPVVVFTLSRQVRIATAHSSNATARADEDSATDRTLAFSIEPILEMRSFLAFRRS